MCRLIPALLAGFLVSGTALAADPLLVAGDRCELTKKLKVSTKAKFKGKKSRIGKGTVVEVVAIDKRFAEVKIEDAVSWAKAKLLNRACKKIEPPPEPEPVEETPGETPAEGETPTEEDTPIEEETSTEGETPAEGEPATEAPADVEPVIEVEAAPVETPVVVEEESDRDKVKVAVMEVRGSEGMPAELLSSFTALIPSVLDELGPFKSITSHDIQQMLQMESLKQSLGCTDVSCLAEIGGAIGADYMLTGSVIMVGSTYLLQFQLMNIGEAKVEERVSREHAGGLADLVNEVRTSTKLLVRGILAQKSGTLAVSVAEEGATIELDGTIVGVSPMEPFTVAGGTHTIAIKKEGFVLFSKDVDIEAKKQTDLKAMLLPSEEFKREYEASAGLVRTLAWVGMGVGVAALGTGTALVFVSKSKADDLRDRIRDYNRNPETRTTDLEASLDKERDEVAMLDAMVLTAGVVGVVALGTGLTLYLIGDDPDRFTASTSLGVAARDSVPSPSVSVTLVPGGIGIAGTF